MLVADVLLPLVPWLMVAGSFLVGVGLEALLHWDTRLRALSVLRGALVLYALALGVYLAPFSYTGKNELIEERMVSAVAIIATVLVAQRLAVGSVAAFGRSHASAFSSVSLLMSVVRITVLVVGALIVFQSLGIAIAPILTAFGVGGLAVALALQTTLANLFAGIQIIAARQMRLGDYIKIDDNEGYINDITWRTTTIRDQFNNIVVIPNARLAAAVLTNYSLSDQRVLTVVTVTVRHGASFAKVEQLALDVARAVGQEPYVRFQGVTDVGIALSTFFTVARYGDQFLAKSRFVQQFYERSVQEGMMLPSQPWAEIPNPSLSSPPDS
jgi:small-conductance mechanosensitive channel